MSTISAPTTTLGDEPPTRLFDYPTYHKSEKGGSYSNLNNLLK